jgi:Protein of unknown function (DUF1615)
MGRVVVPLAFAVVAAFVGGGCAHTQEKEPSSAARTITRDELARALPSTVKDREGWADDILEAIRRTSKAPTHERACAVVAIIGQESGFKPDPAVAGLPRIVREGLKEKLARLGPLADPALDAILDGHAPGSPESFGARIDKLKTERDLDRLFRDIAAAYRAQAPGTFAVASALSLLLGKGSFEDLNPVTTAGSMQVKVSFARALGEGEGLSDEDVREQLYTRGGGVRFGTARLLGYSASYREITHRFADYNAGVYASRNAAFQAQLTDLTGIALAPDGDVLAWDDDGDAKDTETNTLRALVMFGGARGLSASAVRKDALKEKSEAFEQTETWRAVREAWKQKTGKEPPYARIPEVALASPKLAKPRTTAWFAHSVKRRYDACRALAP